MSLLRCNGCDEGFEVIVVDNASSDDTATAVARLIRDHPDRELRYVAESRLGLHHARHAGARAARSDLLLYLDDDAEAEYGWVRAYVEAFADHPEMVAAGGPLLLRWESPPPTWVTDMISGNWFCLPLGFLDRGEEFLLEPNGHFWGGNMAIRTDALSRFGGFRPDMIGSGVVGSGEWGLQEAMRRAEAQIGWIPAARAWHWVPNTKLDPRYFERWVRWDSTARMFERWHEAPRGVRAIGRDFRRIVRSNWRPWLRAAGVRRAPDARAIEVRSQAWKGLYELEYLWKIITRPDIRALLDADNFGK
jgi:glucosyl-dolichyl phosphate glucuronosyltransferase